MTDALREELMRVGDTVPPAAVPGDLWRRGRRARRRGRLVAGGAVLSVLLVLGGLGVVLGLPGKSSDGPPVAGHGEAVPSVIYPVPNRLSTSTGDRDDRWAASVAETDLAMGRGSVAFTSGEFPLPVGVTAADGAYHLLNLPGWVGANIGSGIVDGVPLALAPDGRHLAYGWYDPKTFGTDRKAVVTAGVRVVDLETGEIRTIELTGGHGVVVGMIRWSPDSRWLVWHGQALGIWTEGRAGGGHMVAGRIAPGAARSESIGISRGGNEQLVIDDRGAVSWAADGSWRVVDRSGETRDTTDVLVGASRRGLTAGAVGPDERSVAMSSRQPAGAASFLVPSTNARGPWPAPLELRDVALPEELSGEGATIEPVGWLDEQNVLELVTATRDVEPDTGWTVGDTVLAVMWLSDGGAEPAYDAVARIERGDEQAGRIQALTVAVDLMTLDHPTRDFPTPAWPWSDERKVAVYGGAAVAVVALLVFGLAYRRGRRLG